MVHTGMLRAFGGPLRRFLMVGLTSRWTAFAAGMRAPPNMENELSC